MVADPGDLDSKVAMVAGQHLQFGEVLAPTSTRRNVSAAAEGLRGGDSFWFIGNRLLTADAGPWRLFVASDARRLKGRTDSTAANWDDVAPLINGLALDSVDLRGLSRRISVGTEGDGDVSSDVARIRASLDDSYQVTKMHVRRPGNEPLGSLNVDFTEMTVTAGRGGAPIASLVQAAELFAHRQPPDFSALTVTQSLPRTPPTTR